MGEVWFAPDDHSLPTPWKGVVDGNTGCLYYWNTETNITQYEKPTYWVSSLSLSPSCSRGPFYPPPPTAFEYPNLHPHYQAPAETIINGYTFPTQFPFPNHTHTPTNQPIYPQSQSMVEPIYPEFPSFYPTSEMNSLVPTFQSPYDLNSSIPTFVPQLQFSDLNPSSSFLSMGNYEPQPISLGLNAAPDLVTHSTSAQSPNLSVDFEEMAGLQLTSFHLEQATKLQEVFGSEALESIIPLSGFENAREACPTTILRDEHSSKPFPVELVQAAALLTTHSTTETTKHNCNGCPMEKLWDDSGELRPMSIQFKATPIFFPSDTTKPFLHVDAVYGQMVPSENLCPIGRAQDLLLLADFQRILGKSCGPLVDWELRSFDTKVARLYLNCSLEKSLMNSDNIPEETVQSEIVNHFCNLVVAVDHFSLVTNMLSGLNPILLSLGFVESPVILEVSIPESYQHEIKHEAVAFDKFLVCSFTFIELMETVRVAHLRTTLPNWKGTEQNALASSTGGFENDVHPENLIESLARNTQKFFVKMHGSKIERQCSVLYHWLPSSLNWDPKSMSDAFLCHEFSLSCVTMKFLLSEFCKSGSKFLQKAMVEASLANIGQKVGIGAHWKVMDYAMHLVGVLAIETVVRHISTALVDDQNSSGALIILELQLGLSTIDVLPFVAVIKKLLVIGINSTSLLAASFEDFCNNKLLVCSLITTAASWKFWGQFISLDKSNSDGQLNLRVQSNFYVKLRHRSCILHTAHEQSHFLEQLPKISGIISFAILEHLKNTCRVICFVILVERYRMNFLLSSEDPMSEHWSNKCSKFGACMDKTMISSKWDAISWKLVDIKIVKVVLKEDGNFYYYDKWAISLVILHFGCRSFFFLYECVGHFTTDAENSTIINRGVKYGNMFSCTMTTGTLSHLKLLGLLAIDDDEDLEYIMKTLVSTNATALQSTNWNDILIFHGSDCQAFSMLLIEMTPKPFYTPTVAAVAAKVRPGEPTLLKVPSAIFIVAKIALGHHNHSLEQADALLIFNSMVIPLRCCSGAPLTMVNSTVVLELVLNLSAHAPYYNSPGMINLSEATFTPNWSYWLNWEVMPHATWDFILMITIYFIIRRIVIFGGIHTANSLRILQTGQDKCTAQFYMKRVNAHQLLILNPSDVVVKMGILTLSTYFTLIFALVMAKTIVDADDMIAEVSGTVTGHDAIPFLMSTNGSSGYWHAKKAKAKGFHAIMWGAGIQSTENLIHENPSNVVVHTKAIWLQLEASWFNLPLAQF